MSTSLVYSIFQVWNVWVSSAWDEFWGTDRHDTVYLCDALGDLRLLNGRTRKYRSAEMALFLKFRLDAACKPRMIGSLDEGAT